MGCKYKYRDIMLGAWVDGSSFIFLPNKPKGVTIELNLSPYSQQVKIKIMEKLCKVNKS